MHKKEFITADTLRKLLKFAIKINVELGFYISYTGLYIEIDQFENKDPKKVKYYYFEPSELRRIFEHVKAYARLYKHNLSLC